MDPVSLFGEFKRRRVFRALIAYGIAAFAVLQIVEPIAHGVHWPDAVLSYVVVALAAGFPIVVALAWIFDVKAGRIERTLPTAEGLTGARLGLVLVAIGVLAATPGTIWYFAVRGIGRRPAPSRASSEQVAASIAVLPFADMSAGGDQGYFSDGIAEEILDNLAQVDGLRVIGRTSSFSFKSKGEDLRAIGEKLGVAHVLEGSVRREGTRVRITAQLIASGDGSHKWSRTFDREMTGIFAVQEEIAKAVVEALKIKLLPDRVFRAESKTTAQAYEQVLLARKLEEGSNFRGAAEVYQRIVERLDPQFAPAWAGLAESLLWLTDAAPTNEADATGKPALAAAEKAVALAADLPNSYEARGIVRSMYLWDWEGARSDFERAIKLAPSRARAYRRQAVLLNWTGHPADAIPSLRRAVDLDPLDPANWNFLGENYIDLGQFVLAREALHRGLEIAPTHEWLLGNTAWSYFLEGNYDEAMAWRLKRLPVTEPSFMRAIAAHVRNHEKEAQQELDALLAESTKWPYGIAIVYAARGERDKAFEWLERAVAMHDLSLRKIKVDRTLLTLRDDPRYTSLLQKMNLPLD